MQLSIVPRDEPDLRDELKESIERCNAAADRAACAKDLLDRADGMLGAARERVERLKAEQRAIAAKSVEERAAAIVGAIRGGFDPPMPQIGIAFVAETAELAAATQNYLALEAAANELSAEANAIREEAAAAAAFVLDLAERIADSETAQLAAENIAHKEDYVRRHDRLVGMSRLDHARPTGPRLTDLFKDVELRTDRYKAAVAKNKLYIEQHNYARHREELEAIEEQKWRDYITRLTTDASARFDE